MFVFLLVIITLAATILGRLLLGRWLNHLSILSALFGTVLVLFAAGLIGANPISSAGWLYLLAGWVCAGLASVMFWLIWGLPSGRREQTKLWEHAYRCNVLSRSTASKLSFRSGWQLFLLFGLQSILLGTTDELDFGKVVFAIVYVVFLLLWCQHIFAYGFASHEPLVCWTTAVLALAVFSRLPGMLTGISTVDWLRDFLPLLHFCWILIGPFAFASRKSIRRAYLLFVGLDLILTFMVTDQYLTLRKFNSIGLGLTDYARATDSVVLFGIFMTLPMAGLAGWRYRYGFGVLAATFVSAALLTGTRSHVGAIAAGLIFYLWLIKPGESSSRYARRAVVGWLLLGMIAFGAAMATGLLDVEQVVRRTAETSTLDFGALTQRLAESLAAWHGFQARPLLGQGLGYRMPTGVWSTLPSDDDLFLIHNFYLYVPLKFGLAGIPIFVGFLASMVRTGIATYRQAKLPFDRAFSAGVASLVVALLVESATASRFQDRSATALLSLLMAILLSLRREIHNKVELSPQPAALLLGGGTMASCAPGVGTI
ncbi:MAG TPA: O-antigen ligase family protein [Terriglobales bacterium]|nr:O-antigen ligase family protein [Terriglobales bacterium]